MVYQDFNSTKSTKSPYRIAPLGDRLLAFVFDLVLFTPVISFILASLFRKTELMYFISPDSMEFLVLCGVSFVFVVFLTVLLQSFFLLMMRATPGKYFFKIQVVSLHSPEKPLRFSQALLRSFLWAAEALCLMLPFLEILSDSHRRPLHDRAAGTMTVTLKESGDQGPHLLETQFVRQILLVSSLSAFVWSIFFVGHFYKMAVRGDFKKSELESEDFLCSSVTSTMKPGETRLDKALALYLADEVSDDCLSSEIDFVMWTPNESDKTWAYLAKGMLQKAEREDFEAYLEKSCEVNEDGPACQIAQFEADPSENPLPKGSFTASILQVSRDFEKGLYAEAEAEFLNLSEQSGFESFSQQGLVKAYWAQNKLERAKGAYQNVVRQLDNEQGLELSAWICHEELDQGCSQKAYESCENLKNQIQSGKEEVKENFVALALIREKECRHTSGVKVGQFYPLFEDNQDILDYVKAISKESNLTDEQRAATLLSLALRREAVRPLFLRRLALVQWVDYAKTEKDFSKLTQFLKDKKVRDLSWIKIYEKSLKLFLKNGSEKSVREIVNLPNENLIRTYHLEADQIRAQYLAKDYEKAWQGLNALTPARAPASTEDSNDQLDQIRQELTKLRHSARGAK